MRKTALLFILAITLALLAGCSGDHLLEPADDDTSVSTQAALQEAATNDVGKKSDITQPTESTAVPMENAAGPVENAAVPNSNATSDIPTVSTGSTASNKSGSAPDNTTPAQHSNEQTPAAQPTDAPAPNTPSPTTPPIAHQHSYTTKVVSPTCTKAGYTEHVCSCGESFTDNQVASLGHDLTYTRHEATIYEEGYRLCECTRCGYSYKDEIMPKLEQQFYDVNQAMAVGNAYALSIGFYEVDYSMNYSNSSYYPGDSWSGTFITAQGGQAFLEQKVREKVSSTKSWLESAHPNTAFHDLQVRVHCYVTYNTSTDEYLIDVFYG